jgi:hypothetical protein
MQNNDLSAHYRSDRDSKEQSVGEDVEEAGLSPRMTAGRNVKCTTHQLKKQCAVSTAVTPPTVRGQLFHSLAFP